MYSALSVANAFIKRGLEGRLPGLTPMKLQKLLFFTQAWYLKVVGEPLIDEIFTRRENGPILPSVYYQLKDYDERIVGQTIRILGGSDSRYEWKVPVLREDDENTWDLIDAIIGSYGHLSPRALSDMTHLPGSAWSQGRALCEAIPNEAIRLDPTIK